MTLPEIDGPIAQHGGWSLYPAYPLGTGIAHEYEAVRGGETVRLGVSRFGFSPTAERFAWLVDNGFPSSVRRAGGALTPICDEDIDAAIEAARKKETTR